MSKSKQPDFTFEISLSVLNHLGRNLYRSFATVLGEAISNSWDAGAENVHIYINREKNSFIIKDDGTGMTAEDFRTKFLKIGYSKRNEPKSQRKRPYIGGKGIGKLALLSCAKRITVISKVRSQEYVGGVIDNDGLDDAIKRDDKYPLGLVDVSSFRDFTRSHKHGTIIRFDEVHEGIKHRVEFIRKVIALSFRFALIDHSFKIFVDNEEITFETLRELAENTQFVWRINNLEDPFIDFVMDSPGNTRNPRFDGEKEILEKSSPANIRGFIASVLSPKNLAVTGTEERVGVDLFVNGRIRERNILEHIPTARVPEQYLYGQIHFDDLDIGDNKDRFATGREGIVADDEKFKHFLKDLQKHVINPIVNEWDILRKKHKLFGDPENESQTPKERITQELFFEVASEYSVPKDSPAKHKIDKWIDSLAEDAEFNFASYADCFMSENLIRYYIRDNRIKLSPEAIKEVDKWKKVEIDSKNKGNISIQIRRNILDDTYLAMNDLAYLVDNKKQPPTAVLARDADEYKPMRDAVAHTSLLTDVAKLKLSSVFENIKARIIALLISAK